MGKTRISVQRRPSAKTITNKTKKTDPDLLKGRPFDPVKFLLNEKKVAQGIWECLKEGDYEGVVEILEIHLETRDKVNLAKREGLAKTTLYHSLRSKNPTIKTLAKLVQMVYSQ